MAPTNAKMWMIRAGRNGTVLRHFLDEGVAYFGWGQVGPISPTDTKANVRRRLDENYPHEKAGTRPNIVGMLRRFSCEVRVGDAVVTADPRQRLCRVGLVRSGANHQTVTWVDLATGRDYPEPRYVRKVDWVGAVQWDSLTANARKVLNGQLSHFWIREEASEEICRHCL